MKPTPAYDRLVDTWSRLHRLGQILEWLAKYLG